MKALLLLTLIAVIGCGGKAVFRLSSDENNSYELGQSLQRRQLPASPQPVNSAHQPRVFAVTAGTGANKTIVGYDLASGNALWKADADIKSRISVGGDFIVAYEGNQLVARDQARGQPRWRERVPGTFVGAAADSARAYVVYKDGSTWWLVGYDGGSGKQLWRADASGELGGPAAHGGIVYVPFFKQWLSLVDGASGKQLTRLRGLDQEISTLRVTSRVAYYGSKQGMFELDARSASGKRTDATYGQVKLPAQLEGTTYAREVYDPVQQGYTAADRKRVLWTSTPVESGPMKLGGDGYVVHYFRYVLGFGLNGGLRWAYSQPRVELVASEHSGSVIVALSSAGDVVALDPQTGAVRARKNLGTTTQVLGATFDVDGWAPTDQAEPVETVASLTAIARDRDARFDRVKELAVQALAKLPGAEVTSQLLAILADNRAPQRLKDTVVELLVERHDPGSLPVLTQQLAVHSDYIAKTEPEALGPVAKAIAGLGGMPLDPKLVAAALVALQLHLDSPATSIPDLVQVIDAMAAIGNGGERTALGSHLLLYHAEDELGGDPSWQKAIAVALETRGGPGEHALLRAVAADPRTKPALAGILREVMGPD
ncbi:MAG: PQQ-binding-like beta-propeller repeat protein [Kofleriaceae bacterium]